MMMVTPKFKFFGIASRYLTLSQNSNQVDLDLCGNRAQHWIQGIYHLDSGCWWSTRLRICKFNLWSRQFTICVLSYLSFPMLCLIIEKKLWVEVRIELLFYPLNFTSKPWPNSPLLCHSLILDLVRTFLDQSRSQVVEWLTLSDGSLFPLVELGTYTVEGWIADQEVLQPMVCPLTHLDKPNAVRTWGRLELMSGLLWCHRRS